MLLLACEKDQNLSSETSQQTISARSSVPGGFDYVIPNDLNDKQLVLEKVQQLEGRYHLYEQDSLNPGTTADIEWENAVWYAEALYNFLSRYETWPEDKHADFFNPIESSANLSFTVSSEEAFVSEADLFTLLDELTDYTGQDIAPTTDLAVNSVDGSNLVVSIKRIPIKADLCNVDPIRSYDGILATQCVDCSTINPQPPRKCLTQFFFEALPDNCHSEALAWFYNLQDIGISAQPLIDNDGIPSQVALYYVPSIGKFNPVTQNTTYQSKGSGNSHKSDLWGAATANGNQTNWANPNKCLYSAILSGYVWDSQSIVYSEQPHLNAKIWYSKVEPKVAHSNPDVGSRHRMTLSTAFQGLKPI